MNILVWFIMVGVLGTVLLVSVVYEVSKNHWYRRGYRQAEWDSKFAGGFDRYMTEDDA